MEERLRNLELTVLRMLELHERTQSEMIRYTEIMRDYVEKADRQADSIQANVSALALAVEKLSRMAENGI
jgi:hypothetical protein